MCRCILAIRMVRSRCNKKTQLPPGYEHDNFNTAAAGFSADMAKYVHAQRSAGQAPMACVTLAWSVSVSAEIAQKCCFKTEYFDFY